MNRAILVSVVLTLGAAQMAGAQGISRAREELGRAGFASGARIEVRETDDAAAAVRSADSNPGPTAVTAYGVSLLRDNSQNARANAYGAAAQFAEMYPDIPVKVSYESPWFRVEAGLFIDRTEAVALCGRVIAQFKTAVVMQQEVSVADIIAMEKSGQVIEIRE